MDFVCNIPLSGDRLQAAKHRAAHRRTRQPMTARQAMPEIERQDTLPTGHQLAVLARAEMPLHDACDQCRQLIAPIRMHSGEKRNDTVLSPRQPGLVIEMALLECIDEQPGG